MWLISARKSHQTQSARRSRSPYRLRIEALEDRCVPNAGYLDPTFGAAGAGVITPGAGAVLIQPADGKILASNNSTVTRYNTNGSSDTSFGSGGTQATIGAVSMALQSDGKILLVGSKTLERLNGNGLPDTSFGANGMISESNYYTQIVVQPNGQIVIAGSNSQLGGSVPAQPTLDLARYNSDGSLDKSFGNGGFVNTNMPFQNTKVIGKSLLLQANSELIVVADTGDTAPQQWVMAHYNANGSLDTSFGTSGMVITPSAGNQIGNAWVNGAVLYPSLGTANDGKIAIVGKNAWLASGPLLVRFNTNGSLDNTFGNSGQVALGLNPSGVAFDASERFLVAGSTGLNSSSDTALERLNPDGTPDTTFSSSGVVTAGLPSSAGAGAPAIYPNTGTDTADYGKIVTAGSHVARFLPSAPASSASFVVTGPSSTTAGASFSVTVTATDANGNVLTGYTGTVDFASFDPQAVLPANYTFTAADQGMHTFTVTLKTAGVQALFVADTAAPTMNGREVGIQVNPGQVAQLIFVDSPVSVKRGSSFSLYVEALDAYGNPTTFSDTMHFSSSDPRAVLPSDETFPGNFANLGIFILRTRGTQTITMTDISNPSLSCTVTIQVT